MKLQWWHFIPLMSILFVVLCNVLPNILKKRQHKRWEKQQRRLFQDYGKYQDPNQYS